MAEYKRPKMKTRYADQRDALDAARKRIKKLELLINLAKNEIPGFKQWLFHSLPKVEVKL